MKKNEITMWDLRKAGMSDELFRHYSDSDYRVFVADSGYEIYIGNDYCQTFPTVNVRRR